MGEPCAYDYRLAFADYQSIHLLRQRILEAQCDLVASFKIAEGVQDLYEGMQGRGLANLGDNIDCRGIRRYKDKISTHQQAVKYILQRLEGTAALVRSTRQRVRRKEAKI